MISPISTPAPALLSLALYGTAAAALPSSLLTYNKPYYNSHSSIISSSEFHSALAANGNGTNSTGSITWGPCPSGLPNTANVQCGTIQVPLDWEEAATHPSGSNATETISLGLLRLAAADPAKRIGPLFVNPGGPGGQATDLAASIAAAAQEPAGQVDPATALLIEHFDIIGLDPRGVGLSTPVKCAAAVWNERVTLFPQTEDEFDALVQHNQAVAKSCREKTGRLLDYVDTISAARDHEAVRLALGNSNSNGNGSDAEKASFLGLSYGTQLFTQYAQLYPSGIRAMVLDGNLQHSQSEAANLLIESATYEATLEQFFTWAAQNNQSALFGQDARQTWLDVLAAARRNGSIPAPYCDNSPVTGCRSDVTEEEVRLNAQGLLIKVSSGWRQLAQALAKASKGDAALLSQAQPLARGIGDDYRDSYLYGGNAIQCQDWTHGGADFGLAGLQSKAQLGAIFTPLTRGASQSYTIQTRCIGWPTEPRNPPAPVSYAGDATLLMVNSIYDPSTSYAWALGLQSELGYNNTVLLTRNGAGHTSFFLGGETSLAEANYLVDLKLPEPGTTLDS